MAGIGFELRKVAGKGGIGSFFQIAFSGAMIVAGPWILCIITITAIKTLLNRIFGDSLELFMGIVIYSYAFSLFLFGGFHYIFTRRMSDLLYVKKDSEAFGYVLRLCIPVAFISILIALPAVFSFDIDIPHMALFRFSAVLTFVSLNCLWIVMLFASALKWYIRILLVYTGGLGSSVILIFLLAAPFGTSGAMLGFAAGHLLIVLLLLLLCRIAWKPETPPPPDDLEGAPETVPFLFRLTAIFVRYTRKHKYLFGAGLLYYWGIWIDKIVMWAALGSPVPGTFIRLFELYDIPVFYANLSMIPGLVFFVIYSETEFYVGLKRFLLTLTNGRYSDIFNSKKRLCSTTGKSLKEQCLLQAIVTVIAVILTGNNILKITLTAVFFHLLLLTLLNYLFYIEQYRHAFIAAAIFFTANLLAVLTGFIPGISFIPGLSYTIGAAAADVTAGILLKRDLSRLERHILTKN